MNWNPLPALSTFLEREGGRICVSLFLVMVSNAMYLLHIPKWDELLMLSVGFLGRELGSSVIAATTTTTLKGPSPGSQTTQTVSTGPTPPPAPSPAPPPTPVAAPVAAPVA